jgi:hypothetical protein
MAEGRQALSERSGHAASRTAETSPHGRSQARVNTLTLETMAKHATAIALWQVGRQVPPVELGSYDGSPGGAR